MPPDVLAFLDALIIHFFSSAPFSACALCASAGAEISCIANRKSAASGYATEKARDESREKAENELEELGRSSAETLLGAASLEGACELDSGKTRVMRAISCAFYTSQQCIILS